MQEPMIVFETPEPLLKKIAKDQFLRALFKARTQPCILSLCFQLKKGDDSSLIRYFSKKNIPFLYQSNHDTTHLFAGQLLTHQASGKVPRFEEANAFFNPLKPLYRTNNTAYPLHLACAFDFEEQGANLSLICFVPHWHYFKTNEASFLSFYYHIHAKSSLAILEKEFSENLRYFQSIEAIDLLPLPSLSFLQSTVDRYPATVLKALEILKAQHYQKITLAAYSDYRITDALDLSSILAPLKAEASPSTTVFCWSQAPGRNFFGATPETLLRTQDHTVFIDALAGSIPRQGNSMTDRLDQEALLKDSKILQEHQLVIDAIVQDLKALSINPYYPNTPQVKSLKYLHHLFTPIQARYNSSNTVFSLIQALHPTPALGTYPKKSDADLISSLENFERKLYGGGLGWMNSAEDSHITVNIRCAAQDGERLRFFAGCGLTAASIPHIEQKELETKLKTLLSYFRCT